MLTERLLNSLRQWGTGVVRRTLPDRHANLGDRGENLAAEYLRRHGFRILVRNYRCPAGEIDLICRQHTTVVFVEVKTRVDENTLPEHAVGPEKQRHISRVAEHYLGRFGNNRPAFRHDVVAVLWPTGREAIVQHYPSFFEHRI